MAEGGSGAREASSESRGQRRRLRVLVVDPSERNLRVLRDSLPRHGIDVLVTSTGEEALELAAALQPDAVLAEARLTDLSPEEFLQRIGAGARRNRPVVLLMTQSPMPEEIEHWLQTGAQDVLRKPMFVAEIAERLKMVVRREKQIAELVTTEESPFESDPERVNSLLEYVEILSAERRTGTLHVHDGHGRHGKVGLKEGNITFAEVGHLRGEKAAYTVLSWDGATWRFEDEEPTEENVRISTIAVILEAMRWREAKRELIRQLPSPVGPYRLTQRFLALKDAGRLPQDGRAFLELVADGKTVSEILAASPYDDRETLEKLVKMFRRGVIETVRPVQPRMPEIEAALREQVEEAVEERVETIPEEKRPETAQTQADVQTVSPPDRWVMLLGSERSGALDLASELVQRNLVRHGLSLGRRSVSIGVGDWEEGVGLLVVDTRDLSDALLNYLLPRVETVVLVVGANERQKWEYMGYLYRTLRERFSGRMIIGLLGDKDEGHLQNVLRETLDLVGGDRLIFVQREDPTPLRAAVQVSLDLHEKGVKTV